MSNAYEFVKEMIARTKNVTAEQKLAKLDEFMKIAMESFNENYPDWYIGQAVIFGNRYDKLEIPDEGGSVDIYKDCEEFHDWLRSNNPEVPHYVKAKDNFFSDNEYSKKFFKFYQQLHKKESVEDKSEFLEEIVNGWNEKYGKMSEVDLFLEVKTLKHYMNNDRYNRSYYGVDKNPAITKGYAMAKLLDMFYYFVYYKYDLYISLCKPKHISYKVTAADITAATYMYGQTSTLPKCVFDGGESYTYNEDPNFEGLFPLEIAHQQSYDYGNYPFQTPDEYIAYDGENDFVTRTFPASGEPTVEDAIKAFDIGLYDFPGMNLSGGGGIAVIFKRVGDPVLVHLDDHYCDEVWE